MGSSSIFTAMASAALSAVTFLRRPLDKTGFGSRMVHVALASVASALVSTTSLVFASPPKISPSSTNQASPLTLSTLSGIRETVINQSIAQTVTSMRPHVDSAPPLPPPPSVVPPVVSAAQSQSYCQTKSSTIRLVNAAKATSTPNGSLLLDVHRP